MAIIDSPAIKERSTVSIVMFTVILALLPALFLQIGFFGYQILGNLFIGIGFALFLEAICLRLRNYPIRPFVLDGSAFVAAWLLGNEQTQGLGWHDKQCPSSHAAQMDP